MYFQFYFDSRILLMTLLVMVQQHSSFLTNGLLVPRLGGRTFLRLGTHGSSLKLSTSKKSLVNESNVDHGCRSRPISFLSSPYTVSSHILKSSIDDNDAIITSSINTAVKDGIITEEGLSDLQHLLTSGSKISPYWIDKLSQVEQGTARSLMSQLTPDNAIGFVRGTGSIKESSLLGYVIEQKKKYPDYIILIKNGKFYETYGIDSIMMIAYCGLNEMGGRAQAGCPTNNIQATLDKLTSNGFSCAVYEERADLNDDVTVSVSKKMKDRSLSQIVFPGASTYIYDLSLKNNDIIFRENFPLTGVMKTLSGYTLCQGYLDEQAMDISERWVMVRVRVRVSIRIPLLFLLTVSIDENSSLRASSIHLILTLTLTPT
jgi:hypothetical protein